MHLVGCHVTVNAEVSSDLLEFAATSDWEEAFVGQHYYLSEFLLCSEGFRNLVKISVTLV